MKSTDCDGFSLHSCGALRRVCAAAVALVTLLAVGCGPDSGSATRFDDADCNSADLPRIVRQPMNATVDEGGTAEFTVAVLGLAPIEYRWTVRDRAGNEIESIRRPSVIVDPAPLSDNGNTYQVFVSNDCTLSRGGFGEESARARLTVVASAPRIDTQPSSATVNEGQVATFAVVAGGSRPLSYQWRRNGVDVVGATSASLTTPATTAADNGAVYTVVVTNPRGTLMSQPATLTVQSSPAITRDPMPVTVVVGAAAAFDVQAVGAQPLAYQWLRNGVDITGATAASYTLATTTLSDDGALFSVRVSNAANPTGVTSATARLTVTPPSAPARGAADIVSLRPDRSLGGLDSGHAGLEQALSQDGRYVAFVSNAPLAAGGGCGVFLRDMQMRSTRLISVKPDGTPGTVLPGGQCRNATVAMTPEARHVAFVTDMTDLVNRALGSARTRRAYVRDTCIGAPPSCVPRTALVSVDDSDAPIAAIDREISISDDGRYVAFAGQLAGSSAAFVHDRDADGNGVFDERPAVPNPANPAFRTFPVNRLNSGQLVFAIQPMISGNGRFVAFTAISIASGTDCLRPGFVNAICVYVHDRDANNNGILDENGVPNGVRTVNVSVNSAGQIAQGAEVGDPWISADGRVVKFRTGATNLGATNPALVPIYVHDRDVAGSGFFDTPGNVRTELASRDAAGNEVSSVDFIGRGFSRRGRFILLLGAGSWAAPTDPENLTHLYLRDTCLGAAAVAGCVPSTVRLSVKSGGALPDSIMPNAGYGALSGDGRRVAFAQSGGGLVDLDGNGVTEPHTGIEVYFGSTGTGEP